MAADRNLTRYTRVRERWELTRRRVGDGPLVPFTNEPRPEESPGRGDSFTSVGPT